MDKIKKIIETTQKYIENQSKKKKTETEKLQNKKNYDYEKLYKSVNAHFLFSKHTEKVIQKMKIENKQITEEEITEIIETTQERLKIINNILKQQLQALEKKDIETYLDLYEQEKIIDQGTANNYEKKLKKFGIKIPRKTILKTTLIILLLIGGITNTQAQTTQIQETRIENIQEIKTKKAILIVDMQEDYVKDLKRKELEKEIINQQKIIEIAIKKNIPIITLKMAGKGETIPIIKKNIPQDGINEEIEKHDANGFNQRKLRQKIEQLGTKEIIIMGTNASSCVLWTSVGAIENGLKITTSKDIILDSENWHNENKKENTEIERLDFYKKYTDYKENTNQIIEEIKQNI